MGISFFEGVLPWTPFLLLAQFSFSPASLYFLFAGKERWADLLVFYVTDNMNVRQWLCGRRPKHPVARHSSDGGPRETHLWRNTQDRPATKEEVGKTCPSLGTHNHTCTLNSSDSVTWQSDTIITRDKHYVSEATIHAELMIW